MCIVCIWTVNCERQNGIVHTAYNSTYSVIRYSYKIILVRLTSKPVKYIDFEFCTEANTIK